MANAFLISLFVVFLLKFQQKHQAKGAVYQLPISAGGNIHMWLFWFSPNHLQLFPNRKPSTCLIGELLQRMLHKKSPLCEKIFH